MSDDESHDSSEPERPWGLRAVGVLIGLPMSAACLWSLSGPPSVEALVFAVAVLAGTWGAFARRRVRRRRLGLFFAVGALLVLTFRFATAGESETIVAQTGLGVMGQGSGRLVDRVVPERDLALSGSRLLAVLGLMPPDEPGLLDHLDAGYDRMRDAEGAVPSPVLGTFLFGNTPQDFDVLRIAPTAEPEPKAAVVFLHGFIGSVTLLCWEVAQAAGPLGMETICPATTWEGRWARRDGRRIVEQTLATLRQGGVERVYLVGLSAGAIGASLLAPSLDLEGLVLISGTAWEARPAPVATLVLQGARDRMTRPGPARRYANAGGRRTRYVETEDAGHWLILSHYEETRAELGAFLRAQEERAAR